MSLFDTHAHLNDPRFDEDRAQVLENMREAGVSLCLCVGADRESSETAVALAQAHEGIWAAVGVHPHSAKDFDETYEPWLRETLKRPKVQALGEIGLDYHYDLSPRETQRAVFARQLDLAAELDVPTILHVREAHGDVLDTLRPRRGKLPPLVLHCYSGTWETAKAYLALGCYLSLAGPVTFKKAPNLQDVARNAPLDRLLVETDSPYLAPEPKRGHRNEPAFVAHTARRVAELRGMDYEALCAGTLENGKRFFRIP